MKHYWRRLMDWLRWALPVEQCAECSRWIRAGQVICNRCLDRGL